MNAQTRADRIQAAIGRRLDKERDWLDRQCDLRALTIVVRFGQSGQVKVNFRPDVEGAYE